MADVYFKDLPFPVKMMLGYLIGILLLAVLFSISIRHLSTIINDYDILVSDTWRQLDNLQNMRAAGMQARNDIEDNPAQVLRDLAVVDIALAKFSSLSRGGVPLDMIMLVKDYYRFRLQAMTLVKLKQTQAPTAEIARTYKEFIRGYNLFFGRVYVEIERSRGNVELSESKYTERINQILLLNVILAPLSFIFLYYYGYMISNYTGLRLKRFLGEMKRLLAGDRQARIEVDSQDEIGQIAAGINQLAEKS